MPLSKSKFSSSAWPDLQALLGRYQVVRARSIKLAASLSPEDAMVQSMEDASPAKWHLAHTTWFFERFVLAAREGYLPVDARWDFVFNSYYHSVGPMHARPRRGLLSRPALAEVLGYRHEIDARIAARFEAGDISSDLARVVLMGTHHEQQHQELLLTDIKHAFWSNPLHPAYRQDLTTHPTAEASPLRWIACDEVITEMGAAPWPEAREFAFDNEAPRHRVIVPAHALASRPVDNSEYLAFIADGGYEQVGLWMSEGWDRLQAQGHRRPLYWHPQEELEFTLGGWRELDPRAPVCHLDYFEADAFARWAGARLPTEAEWEQAAAGLSAEGNFLESDALHPQASQTTSNTGFEQLFGDVWEWTSTAYTPYPGFKTLPGSLGEYNGKFMSGQWVLRGGSCATPGDHIRATYRNFFPPPTRWQFSGVRLAKDI